jgi:hypothetical protein
MPAPTKVKAVHRLPPLPLTVTSRKPRVATAVTLTFADMTVSLLRATPVAVTPLPENVTLYVWHLLLKPEPVIVTGWFVAPWASEFGETEPTAADAAIGAPKATSRTRACAPAAVHRWGRNRVVIWGMCVVRLP